jgi:hypothetical protein
MMLSLIPLPLGRLTHGLLPLPMVNTLLFRGRTPSSGHAGSRLTDYPRAFSPSASPRRARFGREDAYPTRLPNFTRKAVPRSCAAYSADKPPSPTGWQPEGDESSRSRPELSHFSSRTEAASASLVVSEDRPTMPVLSQSRFPFRDHGTTPPPFLRLE